MGPIRDGDPATTVSDAVAQLEAVRHEVGRVIVGQEALVTRLLIALLCDGHCLLEGVPGLAKSLMVQTLARTLDVPFVRLQFTPDLLPADLTGTEVFHPQQGSFEVRKGPIFASIVLADEINRAPAKVQSALLEAMQERQVSIGGASFPLPQPFMVLATQNPIEQEGTYPLPEAQLDRFMVKVLVSYPDEREERAILQQHLGSAVETAQAVLTAAELLAIRAALPSVAIADSVQEYIVRLVRTTRRPENVNGDLRRFVSFGASPRASIYLALAARAHAFLDGRAHTTPDDVKAIAPEVLRHRVVLSYEAEAEGVTSDAVVARLLGGVALR